LGLCNSWAQLYMNQGHILYINAKWCVLGAGGRKRDGKMLIRGYKNYQSTH